MTARCEQIGWEALVGWWLGELPAAEAEALEAHVFACAHCARRGEALAALAGGVRDLVRAGGIGVAASPTFVEAMKRAGLKLREYRVAPGGSVACTIAAGDDGVVSRLEAPLAGVARVDLLRRTEVPGAPAAEDRIEDVPFDPASGEVIVLPSAALLRAMPANTVRMRLVAVEPGGERELGEYAFVHTPSGG